MEMTMTMTSMALMFGAMLVLALVPDSSALVVVARSAASGFSHGAMTTAGIVIGDYVFILIVMLGLTAAAGSPGYLFDLIKYFGAAYLIWLGVSLWLAKTGTDIEGVKEPSWQSNFACGLLITLGDAKAILFYISFLPAFVDLSRATIVDTGIVMLLATLTAGGVKLGYALLANKVRLVFQNRTATRIINIMAGCVMIATAVLLITKT